MGGHVDEVDFILNKKGKRTGTVNLSIEAKVEEGNKISKALHSLGGEFDHLFDFFKEKGKRLAHVIDFQERDHKICEGGDDKDELDAVAGSAKASAKKNLKGKVAPALHGAWKCVDTWGLDDFLRPQATAPGSENSQPQRSGLHGSSARKVTSLSSQTTALLGTL